jgi:UDP-N-acetyl-D-mannosaminuronic acid dehydrogenase
VASLASELGARWSCEAAQKDDGAPKHKGDTDDERDSLSHRLIRLLERASPTWRSAISVTTPTQSFEDAILDADAVIIATNHHEFRGRQVLAAIADSAKGDAVLADPWDCFNTKQVFSRPAGLVAARV